MGRADSLNCLTEGVGGAGPGRRPAMRPNLIGLVRASPTHELDEAGGRLTVDEVGPF